MKSTILSLGIITLVGIALGGCAAPQPVTTAGLLEQMTDLERLSRTPRPDFTCRQFSSYDRRSKTPENQEDWFANADAGHYLRVEEVNGRQEHVLMDVAGPGAIVRMWSANPKGTLRIYLDGAAEPAIEAPMTQLLGGEYPGIPAPLAGTRSSGWNLYFPIPYAEHCKVTSDEGGFYYLVNYRTYEPGTKVVTFDPADVERLVNEVATVANRLSDPAAHSPALYEELRAGQGRLGNADGVIPPGGELGLPPGQGEGAIVGLAVRVEAEDVEAALRELLLTMTFDGEQTVAVPLGDFFGGGVGINAYAGLPMGVTEDGTLWSAWVMPYEKSVSLNVRNTGHRPVTVWLDVRLDSSYEWTRRSQHFHASWRMDRDIRTRPQFDWDYLTAEGQGTFVGAAFTIANPVRNWWGEGDEKIYVDQEAFPSHFGTGTEDYYGYAWCNPTPFTHAYHAQPRADGPSNYGWVTNNRWHVLDCIPFDRHFNFDMEIWHWTDVVLPQISVVTYWYGRPGATSRADVPTAGDLTLPGIPPYVAPRVEGAIEGEEMRVLEKTGIVQPQTIDACSNDAHRWWRGAEPGDRLVLAFPVEKPGRYRVLGRFVNANDYGIVALTINDQALDQPMDLYAENVVVTDELPLGVFDLNAGDNTLTVELLGANEKAVLNYMFGLDYVRLEALDDEAGSAASDFEDDGDPELVSDEDDPNGP